MDKDKIIMIGAGDIDKTAIAEKIANQTNKEIIIIDDVLKGEYHKKAVYSFENFVKPYENMWAGEMTKKQMNAPPMELVRSTPKIQNNEPCPCGSGKKYKKCCKTI